jgi:hypothetical protein
MMDPKVYAEKKLAELLPRDPPEHDYHTPTIVDVVSIGPRIEAGRRHSNMDSWRHGLSGQIHITTPEETAIFQKHCTEIRDALAPYGPIEIYHAQSIAEDMWRLQRARALENGIFALGYNRNIEDLNCGKSEVDAALAQSQTWIDEARNLNLLTVYEQRINRTLEKNTIQLKSLQTERKAAHEHAQNQAIAFAELAESKGQTYDPRQDFTPPSAHGGFVYSRPEIARVVERKSRLSRAWTYQYSDRNPRPKPEIDLDDAA